MKVAQEAEEHQLPVANDNISSLPNPANLLPNSKPDGKEKIEVMHFQVKPRQTILEKLIQNAFGKNVGKLYSQYPNLKQLTQPNLPIIDPRGIEIIKRSQFKESLKLLDNVVTMTKETLNSPKL